MYLLLISDHNIVCQLKPESEAFFIKVHMVVLVAELRYRNKYDFIKVILEAELLSMQPYHRHCSPVVH